MDADLRQFFDPIDPEERIAFIAEELSDGRVLQLGRDILRAGVMAGGDWRATLTGVPQGGVARRMTAEGFRLTRWADDWGVLCQTRAEAPRALAVACRPSGAEGGPPLAPSTPSPGRSPCRGSRRRFEPSRDGKRPSRGGR